MTLILGIDPGLQKTGWGIIAVNSNHLSFIACGVVKSEASSPMAQRLKHLNEGLCAAIAQHRPEEAALEETFVNMNGASTLKLGQARGAILLTLSLCDLPVYEYSANLVKKSVVGNGHADKAQVAMMVKTLLPASNAKTADASDALAIAICHSHHRNIHRITGAHS
jgi:crossover junction endodeoxyribonuclease RuvC